MSRTFTRFLKSLIKFDDMRKFNNIDVYIIGGVITGGLFCHGLYALGTIETKIIKVDKKYQFDRNGFTEFMIIDQDGKHYNVNNSIWYWKWDSIEDWHKLETSGIQNKNIVVKYYGWRVPLFGMFPNIIKSQQGNVSDSTTYDDFDVIVFNRNMKKHLSSK